MTFSNMQFISTVFRRILLALVIVASLFALGRSPVEAAPKINPDHSQTTAPSAATATLTATISPHVNTSYGGYGSYTGCGYGTEDFGDPWGNQDWDSGTYFLQGEIVGATPFVDAALFTWTPPGYRQCYGRGDSFSFNLSSIPASAIVQLHSASLEFVNMMAGSNQQNWFYLNHSSGSTVLGINSNAQFVPNSLILGGSGSVSNPTGYYQTPNQVVYGAGSTTPVDIIPASLVQQWVTNRSSGGLSVWNGFNGGYQFAARTIRLNFTYTTDTTPPTTAHALTGTAGSNGWYTSNVIVTLSATDNVGGSGVASTTMDGSSYAATRTISTEGTTSHTYFSRDVAGNTETTKTFDLKIDKTTPSAAITSHAVNAPVRGTISFGGTASDATSGLASVQVSSDGTTWNSATITGGNWSYSLNTTTLTDGTRAIQVRATDSAGLQTTTSLALLVDNTIPASTFASAPTANAWYAGSVTFSGTSSDATSGVANLQRRTDSGTWTGLSGTTIWSYTVDTTTLSDGAHTFYVAATDVAGNLESTAVKTINVGNVPPVSSLDATCPAPGNNGWCKAPINVVVSTSSTAPLQSVSYWIDGDSESIVSQGSTSFGIIGGVHSASTYATSTLGKKSNTVTKTDLKVDGSPPTIEFRGATNTALVFRISDSDSGVGSWTLQVFNAQGQSVFYKDGTGEFNGDLAWSPNRGGSSSGVGKLYSLLPQSNQFKINIFAKDNAGHENGVQQAQFTVNAIATPLPTFTPTSTPRKVVALPVVVNTATARPSGTPLPTTTWTPIPTVTGVRVAALPPAQPPAIKHPSRIISGVVFRDRNGNGIQDEGEDGLGGLEVEIATSISGERARFVTTSSGIYGAVVAGGNNLQVVRVIVPNGLFPTWGSEQTITSGENVVVNFGLQGMSLGLWVLLIALAACLVWLLSETATLDRRANALSALGEEIESAFSVRLQSSTIEKTRE